MQKRTFEVALLAVLAILLVLGVCGVAYADQTWSDLPDSVSAKYGLTDNQIAAISEGYSNGYWRPFSTVNRAQFTKMAVAAFGIPLAKPPIASYTDVSKSDFYFQYIEGAKAAGVVSGTTSTTFSPDVKITRQQAIAIVARYIAKAQGFNLATMYSADEINTLLAHFADATSISADLRDEVAFAFDMGLTRGDDYGKVNPLVNLTRIQGAAFLIRAQALVPPNLWVPGNLSLVSPDKAEGMIGQPHYATFKVTTADGHPAAGVLVDFDTQMADFYVGNVNPEAQVTNSNGEVTVGLVSTEPGTQRVTASVNGLPVVYVTRYWLALDEVYNTKGATAQNNAGVAHQWAVRVVVFGPGPRSTSLSDWYNAVDESYDPTDIDVEDGIDYYDYYDAEFDRVVTSDGWSIADEQLLAEYGFRPRALAGIDVEWSIYNLADDPRTTQTNESLTSVGNITKVDGVSITPAKTAVGKTNADGLSTIIVLSEGTGVTLTKAIADYPKNPYPEELFDHLTFQHASWWHNYDWDDQPAANALQRKTWIPHTISGGDEPNPISPSYHAPNVGEEKTLVITLLDAYGNPVSGKSVEWYMQGVGFFQTDDSGDKSDPLIAANNVDFDVTTAEGKAKLFVKSYDSGEQIIHAKVRDKGTGGAEGTYITYTAEVQWFDVDIATFDDITTQRVWVDKYSDVSDGIKDDYWQYQNEALSVNPLGTNHTFTLSVYGLKLEYDSTLDEPDGQTPFFDSDYEGSSYDGVMDARDAVYFGGLLLWPADQAEVLVVDDKVKQNYEYRGGGWPFDADDDGIIEADNNGSVAGGVDERGTVEVKVAGKWLTLSFEGAYTMYDYDDDGFPEDFADLPGIYLPLAGKTVTFTKANSFATGYSNLAATVDHGLPMFDGTDVTAPESATPAEAVVAVTDSNGKASITISNNALGTEPSKGPQTVKAVVTWVGNPHSGPELQTAYAKKNWVAGVTASATDVTIHVYIDGIEIVNSKEGLKEQAISAAWTPYVDGSRELNSAHVEVHVVDAYGNDLPDYEVVYLLENINGWLGGTQQAYDTYIPWAYLLDLDPVNYDAVTRTNHDTNGGAPDHDEPTIASDPYAYIVGDGGTESFFFNQWLGSEKPVQYGRAGLPSWFRNTPGMAFDGYAMAIATVPYNNVWQTRFETPIDPRDVFNGFDAVLELTDPPLAPATIGLATDGAKAWTLDGIRPSNATFIPTVTIGAPTSTSASAAAVIGGSPAGVTSVVVTYAGSGYLVAPTVTFTGGGGSGATATATMVGGVVTGITVTNPGTGYISPPMVLLTPAPHIRATGTAIVSGNQVTGISLTNPGAGYLAVPTVTVSAPPISGTTATATATANLSLGTVTGFTVTNPGSGYGMTGSGALGLNSLTGSSIDIQLADDITGARDAAIHVESILRIIVYAPHDGLAIEKDYIWSYQVHQIWEEPVPTTILLEPATYYAVAGRESVTLTAKVLDQFNNVMPGIPVTVESTKLEGAMTRLFAGESPGVTDAEGYVAIGPWSQAPGDWGVERVVASAGEANSNPANVQWVFDDSAGVVLTVGGSSYSGVVGNRLVWGTEGASVVSVAPGISPWSGRTLSVFAAPGGSAMSLAATYVSSSVLDINTTVPLGLFFYVGVTNGTDTDGRPNWIYDRSLPAGP